MTRRSRRVFAAVLAAATLFGGAVAAQSIGEDNRVVPADDGAAAAETRSPGPITPRAFDPDMQTYTVPAASFSADGSIPDSMFFPFGGGYFQGDNQNYGCLVAPVFLPDGARVNSAIAHVRDNSAGTNISVALRRGDLGAGGTATMATMGSTGNSVDIQAIMDDTILEDVVDNDAFTYFLTTCVLNADIRLHSVQLKYQEDLAIDAHSPVIVPVTPFRAYDSRFADGPLGEGENRLVSVRRSIDIQTGLVLQNNAVPKGATAIMFNLAVTNTIGGGFVSVTPGDAVQISSASINWSASGQTLNNGTFVELDGNRRVRAFVGGTPGAQTDFIIDVTGYVIPGT